MSANFIPETTADLTEAADKKYVTDEEKSNLEALGEGELSPTLAGLGVGVAPTHTIDAKEILTTQQIAYPLAKINLYSEPTVTTNSTLTALEATYTHNAAYAQQGHGAGVIGTGENSGTGNLTLAVGVEGKVRATAADSTITQGIGFWALVPPTHIGAMTTYKAFALSPFPVGTNITNRYSLHSDEETAVLYNKGSVGIGIAAPTEKVEVAGNVKATSFLGDGSLLTGLHGPETLTTVGALVNTSGAITTPADADKFPFRDSVSGLLVHISPANLKAWLKTYFDSLYATAASVATALGAWKTIAGQNDTIVDLTATHGGTSTLDFAASNTFRLDATALTVGQTTTVAVANLPTSGKFEAITLIVNTGAGIPVLTWPGGATVAALQASKEHYYTLTVRDNATIRIHVGGVF